MDSATKNRIRLWLRGERAFGLAHVPLPGDALSQHRTTRAPAARETQSRAAAEIASPRRVDDEASVRRRASTAPPPAVFPGAGERNEIAPRGGLVPPPSVEPFTAPLLTSEAKRARLIALESNEVRGCTKCRLCENRRKTVFGEGDVDAKVFFIGEGPGENEDMQGRPFVGRAGEMLNKWIAAMGLRREQVYIANIVKCRPPGNRVPMPDEVATCTPYLERQLEIIRPRVIVTLGLPSLKYMMNDNKLTMGRSRGQWREWRGIKLMPTFHPAYVLRLYTDETRAAVWSDLKMVLAELGMPVPKRTPSS
jgi:uracil-DNA glycosylase